MKVSPTGVIGCVVWLAISIVKFAAHIPKHCRVSEWFVVQPLAAEVTLQIRYSTSRVVTDCIGGVDWWTYIFFIQKSLK